MNDQKELAALKRHLESRGLDEAEVIRLMVTWLGVAAARHSADTDELHVRTDAMARWIREGAEHVHPQLLQGGHSIQ